MKNDSTAERIEAFDAANGGGVGYYTDKGSYHLYLLNTDATIARQSQPEMVMKSGLVIGHTAADGKMSMTWAASSCLSATHSNSSQTRVSSGLGPDLKTDKVELRQVDYRE
ncbi:hypothetical protein [Roseovarius sp. D0-M9]|uniref:hypothetical protein n=1 Tax=Roseovarius sp. D0-M9 TaxID=3127117 RepID=UPI00301049F5